MAWLQTTLRALRCLPCLRFRSSCAPAFSHRRRALGALALRLQLFFSLLGCWHCPGLPLPLSGPDLRWRSMRHFSSSPRFSHRSAQAWDTDSYCSFPPRKQNSAARSSSSECSLLSLWWDCGLGGHEAYPSQRCSGISLKLISPTAFLCRTQQTLLLSSEYFFLLLGPQVSSFVPSFSAGKGKLNASKLSWSAKEIGL